MEPGARSVRVALAEEELTEAGTFTVCWEVTELAAAVKVTVEEPGETATEAGTVRLALLLVKLTVRPPEGAAPLSVTVQRELAGATKETGAQTRFVTVGCQPSTEMAP